jgi:hypothetical protein
MKTSGLGHVSGFKRTPILNKNIEFVLMFYYCLSSFFCADVTLLIARHEQHGSSVFHRTRAGLAYENDSARLIADWPIASLPLSGQFFASLRKTMGSADVQVEVIFTWKRGKQL